MTVNNEINGLVRVMNQSLKEVYEGARCHIFFGDHKVQGSLGTNGRKHIDSEASSSGRNDGCFAFESPSDAGMIVGTDGRFVPLQLEPHSAERFANSSRVFFPQRE